MPHDVRHLFLVVAGSGNATGDETKIVAAHQNQEQGNRQPDANRERFYRALGIALVVHDEEQPGREARDDQNQHEDHDVTHGCSVAQWRRPLPQ